jgi:hypothetical protein
MEGARVTLARALQRIREGQGVGSFHAVDVRPHQPPGSSLVYWDAVPGEAEGPQPPQP